VNQLQISEAACQDLDEISEYFLTRNINAGEKFFQEFNQKCQYLAKFPAMGRIYPSIRIDLRGLPIHGYIILYRITKESKLEIVRVINGRQDIDSLFN